jgi:2,3,4,5-tetrahydropyridine-2-carboxylate N-succinyltransferase
LVAQRDGHYTRRVVVGELTGEALLDALESGEARAAEPDSAPGGWRVHAWVKQGILTLFRSSPLVEVAGARDLWPFVDKAAFPVQRLGLASGVRLVPGGSAVRRGAHVGRDAVLMPPCYVNVGAWIGPGTMVDSHVLVGSCAQVGARVHLSAGVQLGGVLEPPLARPVIVEDDCFVGGQCGLYEGVRIGAGSVLGAGVILTATTSVYDLVQERELRGTSSDPLAIPPRSVVVPGTRPAASAWARERGLAQGCALIVKVRDAATDARTALEAALRP